MRKALFIAALALLLPACGETAEENEISPEKESRVEFEERLELHPMFHAAGISPAALEKLLSERGDPDFRDEADTGDHHGQSLQECVHESHFGFSFDLDGQYITNRLYRFVTCITSGITMTNSRSVTSTMLKCTIWTLPLPGIFFSHIHNWR